jgi:hypothetical protein
MKTTLYLPYFKGIEEDDFAVSNNYYKDENDYANAMRNNFNMTNAAVANGMNNYMNGSSINTYQSTDGQYYRFGGNNAQQTNDNDIAYAKCESIMCGEDGNDEDIDKFIAEYVSKDVQLYIFKLNLDTADEEFEQELNLWFNEHSSIQRYSNVKGDAWILENEPKRNLRLKFINKANEEKYAELVNCKIMEKQGMNIYVILTEEINLIDKI